VTDVTYSCCKNRWSYLTRLSQRVAAADDNSNKKDTESISDGSLAPDERENSTSSGTDCDVTSEKNDPTSEFDSGCRDCPRGDDTELQQFDGTTVDCFLSLEPTPPPSLVAVAKSDIKENAGTPLNEEHEFYSPPSSFEYRKKIEEDIMGGMKEKEIMLELEKVEQSALSRPLATNGDIDEGDAMKNIEDGFLISERQREEGPADLALGIATQVDGANSVALLSQIDMFCTSFTTSTEVLNIDNVDNTKQLQLHKSTISDMQQPTPSSSKSKICKGTTSNEHWTENLRSQAGHPLQYGDAMPSSSGVHVVHLLCIKILVLFWLCATLNFVAVLSYLNCTIIRVTCSSLLFTVSKSFWEDSCWSIFSPVPCLDPFA
jgi:hypothetical protein